jgi:hypothetical protein
VEHPEELLSLATTRGNQQLITSGESEGLKDVADLGKFLDRIISRHEAGLYGVGPSEIQSSLFD